jgi:alkaline phosphatase
MELLRNQHRKLGRRGVVAVVAAGAVLAGTGIAVGAAGDEDTSAALAAQINPAKPKNVILLVGDGMGDSEVTLARYYAKGAAGRLNMDKLAFRGSSIHYVLRNGPGPTYAPNYVGDSAPTATAWSTGKRTSDGRLSQGPSAADNVPGPNAGYGTYMEMAKAAGRATGNVSTAEITDATPAAPSSHISQRACQGPADTRTTCPTEAKTAATPGLGSIAEQQADQGFDVVLGGGRQRYLQTLAAGGTANVIDYAGTKGYQYVSDKAGLDGIQSLSSLPGGKTKVLGLFTSGNMTQEWKPLYARTDAYLNPSTGTVDRSVQGGNDDGTTKCQEGNRPSNEPSLADMTQKAIDLLKTNPKGFTLQVEGASIDKRDHAADVCGQIGETVAFDDAVGKALDFQKANPDTLVIVTADHAHSSQMTYSTSKPATGTSYATLGTVDNAPIRVSYGTADTGNGATTSGSQTHTGAQVPLWASGPQAANVQGTHDETDTFAILNGKTPSTLPGGGTTTVPGPTTTVTGPTTTVPGPSVPSTKPRLIVAGVRTIALKQLRAAGVPVSVTGLNITKVTIVLKRGSRTVARKTITDGTANAVLRYGKARRGTYRVVVTAGRLTKTYTVKVR